MPPKNIKNIKGNKNPILQLRGSKGQLTLTPPPKVVIDNSTGKDSEKEKEVKRPRSEDGSSDSNANPGKKPHEDTASLPPSSESEQVEVEDMEDLMADKEILMQEIDDLLGASQAGQVLKDKLDGFLQKTVEVSKRRPVAEVDVDSIKHAVREDILQEMEYRLREDKELERTARTVCIQGKMSLVDSLLDKNAPPEDVLTGIITTLTFNRVCVLSCRQWRSAEDNSLQSYTVELGSRQQKATLYRYVAAHMRTKSQWAQFLRPLSFRDLVPKRYMAEAKALLGRAAEAKREKKILAYKVKVVGYECLPAMMVRTASRGWYTAEMVQRQRSGRRPAEAGTSGGPKGADRSGEWQQQQRGGEGGGGSRGSGRGPTPQVEDKEASLERLAKNMMKDPTSYIGRIEDELYEAQRALRRFSDLRDNFFKAMEGTEWQAEQDRRDEDNYQEI